MKKRDVEFIKSYVPKDIQLTDKELEKLYVKMCKKNYGQKWLEPDPMIMSSFVLFLKEEF